MVSRTFPQKAESTFCLFRGTSFIDLSSLTSSQEVELDAALPNGGSIKLKVCPTDFNPQRTQSTL
jgi:hypothetical protein